MYLKHKIAIKAKKKFSQLNLELHRTVLMGPDCNLNKHLCP